MLRISIAALVFLVASCAPTGKNYYKPDTSTDEQARDIEYCKTYAEANAGGSAHGGLVGISEIVGRRNSHFKLCMLDRGYQPDR